MHIEITQEDIDLGIPKNPRECPTALACRRAGYPECSVLVTHFRPVASKPLRYRWPREVTYWITAFDNNQLVEPAVFDFNWPEKP